MTEVLVENLDLNADLLELRALGPWLADVLAAAGASEAHGSLELALHEICVNVVTHAYDGRDGKISVRSRCTADAIELEVRDTGRTGFDPDDVDEPVPGVPQIHGYGLMIARQLVDELSYTSEEGTNVWLLRIRR